MKAVLLILFCLVAVLVKANEYQITGKDTTIKLDASRTYDIDGDSLSFSWKQLSGPAVVIPNPQSATVTIPGMKVGAYVFRITVTDARGMSAYKDKKVSITQKEEPKPKRCFKIFGWTLWCW